MRSDGRPDHIEDALIVLHSKQWFTWTDSKNKIYANLRLTEKVGVNGNLVDNTVTELPTESAVNAKLKELQDAWDAANGGQMAYIGKSIESGTFAVLDTSGNTYNGSNTTFSLGTQVGSTAQLLVSHDGVIQKPGTDYSLASGGTQITFSTAPASGASIFIVEISGAVGGPLDSDLNGSELILDTDGDTSITADTDDQIDIRVAGTDQITIKDGALSPVTDNDIDLGTSSLEFKDAFFDGTVTTDGLTVSGTPSFADGSIAIADLDIDGGTDIGADIVDADLFIIDDGAGGTNRKTAASRLKTYVGGAGLVFIKRLTGDSNVSSLNFDDTMSATYSQYLLSVRTLGTTTDTGNIYVRVVDGSADVKDNAGYNWSRITMEAGNSTLSTGQGEGATEGYLATDMNNGSGTLMSGTYTMINRTFDNTARRFKCFGNVVQYDGTQSRFEQGTIGFEYASAVEVHGFYIYPQSGSLNYVDVALYGVKNS